MSASPNGSSSAKLNDDGLAHFSDYFNQVRTDIETERAKLRDELDCYYDALLSRVDKCEEDFFTEVVHQNSRNSLARIAKELDLYKLEVQELSDHCNKEASLLGAQSTILTRKAKRLRVDNEYVKEQAAALQYKTIEDLIGAHAIAFESMPQPSLDFASVCGRLQLANAINSQILTPQMHRDLLKLIEFDPSTHKFKLLHRASEGGFSAAAFHATCDNVGHTLTLAKSTSNWVFGGYTEVKWHSASTSKYERDPNAFIFSLTNKHNLPLMMRCTDADHAVCVNVRRGPVFGHDLSLLNDSMSPKCLSLADPGKCYKFGVHEAESAKARCFIAGSYTFQISELEVYEVTKIDKQTV